MSTASTEIAPDPSIHQLDRSVLTEPDSLPPWIVLSCHLAIALGTVFGGWRIVRTMGTKLTRLQPMGGVCAESSAAALVAMLVYWVVAAVN